ncbi:hypothetical protein RDV84_03470 [Lysobacter yananisis]|uniref:Uncharacterized protein n=1 Tax=Lysobacter yananisis TaxID=1003114 RepID=A0ABY9PA22_9GAMM|nr:MULTISPECIES: hypothetical protein [Lysobacter]QCW24900.1 hypothetical protein FE772_03665 [Lysobacter enzymogenes]UZW60080.1 hypothetical protein BV903_022865 [Lysobacter enzymogenes]WMT03918.1 hypothetical protein RDV84_03470 [Lysobacter yananisis]
MSFECPAIAAMRAGPTVSRRRRLRVDAENFHSGRFVARRNAKLLFTLVRIPSRRRRDFPGASRTAKIAPKKCLRDWVGFFRRRNQAISHWRVRGDAGQETAGKPRKNEIAAGPATLRGATNRAVLSAASQGSLVDPAPLRSSHRQAPTGSRR